MSAGAGAAHRPAALPRWYRSTLLGVLVALAVVTALGWFLAADDRWSLAPAAIALVPAIAAAIAAWTRWSPPVPSSVGSRWAAVAAVALIAAVTAVNVHERGEHVLVDRDPAVYVTGARLLADTGSLTSEVRPGPFADEHVGVQTPGFGRGPTQTPQGYPGLTVVLASAQRLVGDAGLLATPALLGAVALLAFYALASTLLPPGAALTALMVFLANPLWHWFPRDAYSELLSGALVFGGLWWWSERRLERSWGDAALAGCLVGAATFVRIDGLAYVTLAALPWAVAALDATGADREDERSATDDRVAARAFAFAALAVATVPTVHAWAEAPGYVRALGTELRLLLAAVGIGLVLSLLAVAAARVDAVRRVFLRRRRFLAGTVAVIVVAAAMHGLLVRPANLPAPPVANELLVSHALRWQIWYLGPVVVAVALVAAAGAVIRALGGGDRRWLAVLAVLGPPAALYLARASIRADHLWAMRRFLVGATPLLVLLAVAGVVWLFRRVPRRFQAATMALALAAAVSGAWSPARDAVALRDARPQAGALDAVHQTCDAVGSEGAVLVARSTLLHLTLPQALRSFCAVPAASAPAAASPGWWVHHAQAWREEGRSLYLVAERDEDVAAIAPDGDVVARITVPDDRGPRRRVDGIPGELLDRGLSYQVVRVPVAST